VIDVTATAQIDWTFRVGDQVKLRLVNEMDSDHLLLDVTNPGRWMAHCHIAEDHESEMMFGFNVTPAVRASALLSLTRPADGRLGSARIS
jgi:hypothetical protein